MIAPLENGSTATVNGTASTMGNFDAEAFERKKRELIAKKRYLERVLSLSSQSTMSQSTASSIQQRQRLRSRPTMTNRHSSQETSFVSAASSPQSTSAASSKAESVRSSITGVRTRSPSRTGSLSSIRNHQTHNTSRRTSTSSRRSITSHSTASSSRPNLSVTSDSNQQLYRSSSTKTRRMSGRQRTQSSKRDLSVSSKRIATSDTRREEKSSRQTVPPNRASLASQRNKIDGRHTSSSMRREASKHSIQSSGSISDAQKRFSGGLRREESDDRLRRGVVDRNHNGGSSSSITIRRHPSEIRPSIGNLSSDFSELSSFAGSEATISLDDSQRRVTRPRSGQERQSTHSRDSQGRSRIRTRGSLSSQRSNGEKKTRTGGETSSLSQRRRTFQSTRNTVLSSVNSVGSTPRQGDDPASQSARDSCSRQFSTVETRRRSRSSAVEAPRSNQGGRGERSKEIKKTKSAVEGCSLSSRERHTGKVVGQREGRTQSVHSPKNPGQPASSNRPRTSSSSIKAEKPDIEISARGKPTERSFKAKEGPAPKNGDGSEVEGADSFVSAPEPEATPEPEPKATPEPEPETSVEPEEVRVTAASNKNESGGDLEPKPVVLEPPRRAGSVSGETRSKCSREDAGQGQGQDLDLNYRVEPQVQPVSTPVYGSSPISTPGSQAHGRKVFKRFDFEDTRLSITSPNRWANAAGSEVTMNTSQDELDDDIDDDTSVETHMIEADKLETKLISQQRIIEDLLQRREKRFLEPMRPPTARPRSRESIDSCDSSLLSWSSRRSMREKAQDRPYDWRLDIEKQNELLDDLIRRQEKRKRESKTRRKKLATAKKKSCVMDGVS